MAVNGIFMLTASPAFFLLAVNYVVEVIQAATMPPDHFYIMGKHHPQPNPLSLHDLGSL